MVNLLLAVTGSVAAIKADELLEKLKKVGSVRVIVTETGEKFLDKSSAIYRGDANTQIYRDRDEWPEDWRLGDEVLHIELKKWADILIIAPLSANTLAKLAHGLCDNLLSCVVRAWKPDEKRKVIVAPAMNTAMWDSPFTLQHLGLLSDGLSGHLIVVQPVSKKLACGDIGIGGLADVASIVSTVEGDTQLFTPLVSAINEVQRAYDTEGSIV